LYRPGPGCDKKKVGYINKNGEIVIDYKYDFAARFIDDLAALKNNTLWEFIYKDGKYLWEPRFYKTIYL
jgi:hypothetical protein